MAPKTKDRAAAEGSADTNLIKALSHPVRASALTILNQRVASPKEVADEIAEPLGNVSYHINTLLKFGCVELVSTAQRRGATEHYYRGTVRPFLSDPFWAKLSADVRNGVSVTGLKVLNEAIEEALEAHTFDARADRHLSCVSLDLDEEAWREANGLLNQTLERLIEIGNESADRGGAERIRSSFGLLGFESPGSSTPASV